MPENLDVFEKLNNAINIDKFCELVDCEKDDVLNQEDYYRALLSTIGIYTSVHIEEYLQNKDAFKKFTDEIKDKLYTLIDKLSEGDDVVKEIKLSTYPSSSELLTSCYGMSLYIFCAIDIMKEGKFNFNYFKKKYPITSLRILPLDCFNDFDIKLSLAVETDKKLYDNFIASSLTEKQIEKIIITLDKLNIRGTELRTFVREVCKNDFDKVKILADVLNSKEDYAVLIRNELAKEFNSHPSIHSTFKVIAPSQMDTFLFDDVRPFLTQRDKANTQDPIKLFSDFVSLIPENERKNFKGLNKYLDENGNFIVSNRNIITDYDIKAIFTENEIENLTSLKDNVDNQFNLYLSRLGLELRNEKQSSVTPAILTKINKTIEIPEDALSTTNAKKPTLKNPDICVIDYIEASMFSPNTKLMLLDIVLQKGKDLTEDYLTLAIQNQLSAEKLDSLILDVGKNELDKTCEVFEILKTKTLLSNSILKSVDDDKDHRSLDDIIRDLEREKNRL